MELRLFEYYLAIVREGNISKAAELMSGFRKLHPSGNFQLCTNSADQIRNYGARASSRFMAAKSSEAGKL